MRCLSESCFAFPRIRHLRVPSSLHTYRALDAYSNAGTSANEYQFRLETVSATGVGFILTTYYTLIYTNILSSLQ